MANQLPTADEAFGPAPLPIDETVPPEEEAERVTPRHEGRISIWVGGSNVGYRIRQAVFLLTSLCSVTGKEECSKAKIADYRRRCERAVGSPGIHRSLR